MTSPTATTVSRATSATKDPPPIPVRVRTDVDEAVTPSVTTPGAERSLQRDVVLRTSVIVHTGCLPRRYTSVFSSTPSLKPFDKIIVTAGAPYIPDPLLLQLKENGGLLVIPVGEGEEQIMNLVTRKSGTAFEKAELGKFKFVPMLKNKV